MINVGIFCGGYSSEYDISIKSATTILNHLPREEYNPFLVYVKKEEWTANYNGEIAVVSPIDFSFTLKSGERVTIDLAHIYIHGNPGENGKLQAYFEIKEIPFINSNALSSEISFDKWFCNQYLRNFGVNVAKSLVLLKNTIYSPEKIGEELGFPLFIKPTDSGSSYGISKVYKIEDVQPAINAAFAEGRSVICESFLKGTEVTCGVYRDEDGTHALPVVEIVTNSDFFDYEAKYLGNSQEIVPARISEEITRKVKEVSIKVYDLLQLQSLARVDYMLVEGEPYVIEVNTTPGFTEESLVPKMLKHEGISITDFWRKIYAFEKEMK